MIAFDCRLARPDFKLDVRFETGEGITALFGPSGSGKSTVIRLIAGLDRPTDGRVEAGGAVLVDTSGGVFLAPHRRRVGLVFQDAQLFPHLSVRRNLDYGLFFTARKDRRIALDDVLGVLGIGHLLDRRPATLSGGERQRVAIGRALLTSPRILLMDEPLASLDEARKNEILPFIEHLRDTFRIPIIYVSHAVDEVARLASEVVRLDGGKVVASGVTSTVLAPKALSTADRFEAVSVITAEVDHYDARFAVTILRHPAGRIVVPGRVDAGDAADAPTRSLRLSIRSTNVTLALGRPRSLSVRTALAGTIVDLVTDDGPFALATIELDGGDRLAAYVTRLAAEELGLGPGDRVHALIKAVSVDERMVPGLSLDARGG